MPYLSVIEFWFSEIPPRQWWQKNDEFDALIHDKFSKLHQSAIRCELFEWRHHPLGQLAEIIIIDQFSRHLFRDHTEAFAHDSLALALAQQAVADGSDHSVGAKQRGFFYLPYMHSESKKMQTQSVHLFSQPGLATHLSSAQRHRAIIERFGRFPHRNKILGRPSTAEELAFLKQPGSSF